MVGDADPVAVTAVPPTAAGTAAAAAMLNELTAAAMRREMRMCPPGFSAEAALPVCRARR